MDLVPLSSEHYDLPPRRRPFLLTAAALLSLLLHILFLASTYPWTPPPRRPETVQVTLSAAPPPQAAPAPKPKAEPKPKPKPQPKPEPPPKPIPLHDIKPSDAKPQQRKPVPPKPHARRAKAVKPPPPTAETLNLSREPGQAGRLGVPHLDRPSRKHDRISGDLSSEDRSFSHDSNDPTGRTIASFILARISEFWTPPPELRGHGVHLHLSLDVHPDGTFGSIYGMEQPWNPMAAIPQLAVLPEGDPARNALINFYRALRDIQPLHLPPDLEPKKTTPVSITVLIDDMP
ncbi:hypothetical protein GALL_98290 [mine drainage metagenome]|uniref:Uncharacterized protein n=1 Tax=mine drainage metagenome TaxID=410659 RepID=A0A1J5T752_9ZZZZ